MSTSKTIDRVVHPHADVQNARGHADKFWAVALACQKERTASGPRTGEISVRVLG